MGHFGGSWRGAEKGLRGAFWGTFWAPGAKIHGFLPLAKQLANRKIHLLEGPQQSSAAPRRPRPGPGREPPGDAVPTLPGRPARQHVHTCTVTHTCV